MGIELKNKGNSYFSVIIDMKREDFENYIVNQNVGVLSGLSNILKLTYNEINTARKDLFKKCQESKWDKDSIVLYQQLYQMMMKLELKIFIIRDSLKLLNDQVIQ